VKGDESTAWPATLLPATVHQRLIPLAVVGMSVGIDDQADVLGLQVVSLHSAEQLVQTALVKLILHMSRIDEDMGTVAAQHMVK
jgi:hypothetical protein